MRILLHTSERKTLDANESVIRYLKNNGHTCIIWTHMNNITPNIGVSDKYFLGMRLMVVQGLLYHEYEGQDAKRIVDVLKPDIIIPIEYTIKPWRIIYKIIKPLFPEIPVIGLQHSFGGMHKTYLDDRAKQGWNCDYQLVWSQQGKERSLFAGFPEDKIEITGNPNWDKYYNPNPVDGGFVLFVAGTRENYLNKVSLTKIVRKYPDLRFFFKNHPNHPKFWERTISIDAPKRCKFFYDTNIYDLLRRAKVVVSGSSTCGIDALLLNKPTILIEMDSNKTNKFKESGRLFKQTSFEKELDLCLKGKEDTSKIKNFLDYVSYKNDGLATNRTVKAIEKFGCLEE